ncbi:pentatricopeptide repeat-containing protein At2g13600 [Cryptomeria japonica]|uniref:pentatricopeptide repeat-containing protein At2g13600 n=1 Tax=Cryptomeria japonica TaxID=3369 RepID=UPI0027DA78D5|nr:pentatricopeptide repeat-containing protein At2g13600 [Cryptomeria japonica]
MVCKNIFSCSGFWQEHCNTIKRLLFLGFCNSSLSLERRVTKQTHPIHLGYKNIRKPCNKENKLKTTITSLNPTQKEVVIANPKTYCSLLQKCAALKALAEGKNVHTHVIKTGLNHDVYLVNHLIHMYIKCGVLEDARHVFDKMLKRSVVSFTNMIAGYSQNGDAEEALNLFHQMQREGISGNCFTFVSIIRACTSIRAFQVGEQFHVHFIEVGLDSDIVVGTALVDMYAKRGRIEDARNVFDKMPKRNILSWTAMIMGYAQYGPLDEALKLFNQIPARDLVLWNAMIGGLVQNGYSNEALQLFYEMQRSGTKADRITFASILRGCANLAVLLHGKQVHAHIVKSGFELDVVVGSALLDMYAKCGSVENAMEVFDKMPRRNVVSWSAMISACAQHGHGKDSLQLFKKMQEAGIKANIITFVGLLSACSHVGLVDQGRRYFDSMNKEYGLIPTVEHYSCMVDLLGRAGFLDEAEEIIHRMPVEPDAAVWGALLSACRTHGNMRLARHAAEQLLRLKVQDSASYVLLSNIYASLGLWDDVANVRKLMKDRGLKKQPGCSWIEVKNSMHVFISGDNSHPQIDEIYAMLERLTKQMKEEGYAPNTRVVLLDLEE